jgi:hypothetical protein
LRNGQSGCREQHGKDTEHRQRDTSLHGIRDLLSWFVSFRPTVFPYPPALKRPFLVARMFAGRENG